METINYQTIQQNENFLQLPPQSQNIIKGHEIGSYEITHSSPVETQTVEVPEYVPIETQTLVPVEIEAKIPVDTIENDNTSIVRSGPITTKKLVPLRISRMVPEETEVMVPVKVRKMVRKTSEILVPMFEKTEKVLHIPKNAQVELPPSFKNYKTKTAPNFQNTFEMQTTSLNNEPILSQNDIQKILNEGNFSSNPIETTPSLTTVPPSITQTELPPLSEDEINKILNEVNQKNQTEQAYDINPEIYSQNNNFTTSISESLPIPNVELGVQEYQSTSSPNIITNQFIPQPITVSNIQPITTVRRSLSIPKTSPAIFPTSQPIEVTNFQPITTPPIRRTIYNVQSLPVPQSVPLSTTQEITQTPIALPPLAPTTIPIVQNSLFQPVIPDLNRKSIRHYSVTSVKPITFNDVNSLPLTETLPSTNIQPIITKNIHLLLN